jgi:hypothetical protein
MAFNGSGTFLRIRNWTNDAAAGIRIRADRHDSEDDNFAQGLSQCITKDGQTTITANLPMATFRHTNVGEGTALTHYARYDQVSVGKTNWADAGGTADAITASYGVSSSAPVDGQLFYVRASAANTTTTPTFAPDGHTARTIVKLGSQPLTAGNIAGDGHELILRYDLTNTQYELLNPVSEVDSTVNAIGAIGGGTQDIDLDDGRTVTATVDTSETTFTFSNHLSGSDAFDIYITNGGSQIVNWPSSVAWASGVAPPLTASGVDHLVFTTPDGGTTWYGFVAGLDMQ